MRLRDAANLPEPAGQGELNLAANKLAGAAATGYNTGMTKFFAPNIGPAGRWLRAGLGLAFFVAAVVVGQFLWWGGLLLGAGAAFTWFEAARGWCVARACGIKTRY